MPKAQSRLQHASLAQGQGSVTRGKKKEGKKGNKERKKRLKKNEKKVEKRKRGKVESDWMGIGGLCKKREMGKEVS